MVVKSDTGSGNPYYGFRRGSSTAFVHYDGTTILFSSPISAPVPSDARLKEKVTPMTASLDKLLALRGKEFRYQDPARYGQGVRRGFIAQEVEKVFPDWVSNGNDGYKQIAVPGAELQALTVEALREQQKEIAELKKRLAALEGGACERRRASGRKPR
jgi:hypothetical protein